MDIQIIINKLKNNEITLLEALQFIEKTINENKIKIAKLEQQKDQLDKEHKDLTEQLEIENIKEEDLEQTINNINAEVTDEVISSLEALK